MHYSTRRHHAHSYHQLKCKAACRKPQGSAASKRRLRIKYTRLSSITASILLCYTGGFICIQCWSHMTTYLISPLLCCGPVSFLGRGPQVVKRVMFPMMIHQQNAFQTCNKRITLSRHLCVLYCIVPYPVAKEWPTTDTLRCDGWRVYVRTLEAY